jgi:hypothetical protein
VTDPDIQSAKGRGIVLASWIGSGVFLAAAAPLAATGRGQLPAVVVDLALFAGGCGAFLWALALAAGRSRQEEIGMGGLFFLAGSAPTAIRRHLLGSLTAQVVGALATAAARPFTALAFGVLVPVWGLALCGLWAARYGIFGPRLPRAEPVREGREVPARPGRGSGATGSGPRRGRGSRPTSRPPKGPERPLPVRNRGKRGQ